MKFGEYFKRIRKEKGFTQEQIALAIGKSKMLVSGVETGKNDAFVEKDLEIIAEVLQLTDKEKKEFFCEATKARARLPMHVFKYLDSHSDAYDLLEIIVRQEMDDSMLKKIIRYAEDLKNAKNN